MSKNISFDISNINYPKADEMAVRLMKINICAQKKSFIYRLKSLFKDVSFLVYGFRERDLITEGALRKELAFRISERTGKQLQSTYEQCDLIFIGDKLYCYFGYKSSTISFSKRNRLLSLEKINESYLQPIIDELLK